MTKLSLKLYHRSSGDYHNVKRYHYHSATINIYNWQHYAVT